MPDTDRGIISVPSAHSVSQTVTRIQQMLAAKRITLFATIDHAGGAATVGMKMPPTVLLIFGSPKAGTPLMQAAPTSALDLPLKLLVWEDAQQHVWISYNSPQYLQHRHGIPDPLLPNIALINTLANGAAGE